MSHPFSELVHLHQIGFLDHLTYKDLGQIEGVWAALISTARTRKAGELQELGLGTRKQNAKRSAAAQLLQICTSQNQSAVYQPISPTTSSSYSSLHSFDSSVSRGNSTRSTSLASSNPDDLVTTHQNTSEPTQRQQKILSEGEDHLATLRQLAQVTGAAATPTCFLSVDVEAWERDSSEILEVGVAWVMNIDLWSEDAIEAKHFIVEDALHLHNGTFVADNRDKFNFGTSSYIRKAECKTMLSTLFAELACASTICLFGHSVSHDIRWLTEMGVAFPANILICDIALVDGVKRCDHQKRKLTSILGEYGVEHSNMHNGGNDAVFTLACAVRMMKKEESTRMEQDIAKSLI